MGEIINNIPRHWGRTKVSEVGKLLRGVNYKKEEASSESKQDYLPVLRGNNINGELNFNDLVYVQKKNISQEQLIKSGDIVFAMSSGSKHLVGKSAKAKLDFNGTFGAFCGVFRPNEDFNKNFVAYFFQSPYYKKVISEISKGTNINNLKREHILDLDFPVPPLPEQLTIVAKIEELFSELENGKQQLLTAQQQLKVYRQSLLKWAFEGKLTNKNVKEGELPKGWKNRKLFEVCEIKNGKNQRQVENTNGKYPIYGSAGKMGYADSYLCEAGSTIVGRKGTINKPLYVDTRFWNVDTAFGFIPNIEIILNRFLYFFCLSFNFAKLDKSTTIPSLAKTDLQKIDIIIPSLEEQHFIVSELESKLTVCEKIEETIAECLQQSETLKQSILKKAFEGKLVNNPKNYNLNHDYKKV